MRPAVPRRRIFTWHVHGSYLYYLAQSGHELLVPVRAGRAGGYAGRPPGGFPWPDTVREVPAEDVARTPFDVVLFQAREQWSVDQHRLLSPAQRRLPRIYLEHDPPRAHPTDTVHPLDDPDVLLVHVTPFNALMWSSPGVPTRVIDHGVTVPDDVAWTGELARGLVIVNHLRQRGRRLGADVFDAVRRQIPLDLIGMGSEELGGLGEVPHRELPAFAARYRFLFNPIRWTSLGLAVCEAMMVGLPVIGLATTEMATAVENGRSGWVDTDVQALVAHMRRLLADPDEARRLSAGARRRARERFGIDRFVRAWDDAFTAVCAREPAAAPPEELHA
jgi:glycosyltransferase involved in cell wall biosynthesis